MVGNGEVMQERMMMSQPAKPPNKHNTKPLGERMDRWTDGSTNTFLQLNVLQSRMGREEEGEGGGGGG